jgi:phosphoribosylaminoimidazole carboxylase
MVNLLGEGKGFVQLKNLDQALKTPGLSLHLYGKTLCRPGRKMGHYTLVGEDLSTVLLQKSRIKPLFKVRRRKSVNPVVGIIMGSDSDLPTMVEAEKILKSFNIPLEITVVSAHRTVDRMVKYAETATEERGLKVIIAGAGGAAHLPGMVAAMTTLPVIGVPIKSSKLSGLDSLLSIVQMPGGIPVATVAIGGGKNAGSAGSQHPEY